MSIAPCQLCGGTGFIDAPATLDENLDERDKSPEELENSPHGEQIPCPICSGSGSNTGL